MSARVGAAPPGRAEGAPQLRYFYDGMFCIQTFHCRRPGSRGSALPGESDRSARKELFIEGRGAELRDAVGVVFLCRGAASRGRQHERFLARPCRQTDGEIPAARPGLSTPGRVQLLEVVLHEKTFISGV